MKFFADTADVDAIAELTDLGLIDGVTTNPTLVAKSGKPMAETIAQICAVVDGPVSAEVLATEADIMILEVLPSCLRQLLKDWWVLDHAAISAV